MRDGDFYPSALEKGLCSERALHLTLAEMYLQGVSTRKVSAIIEQLCGSQVSSTQVSRATQLLDKTLQEWRTRPLGECPNLYLDARYEKVRDHGQVRDAAVLIASGVTPDGKRRILGVSVSLGEHEVHWRSDINVKKFDTVARPPMQKCQIGRFEVNWQHETNFFQHLQETGTWRVYPRYRVHADRRFAQTQD